MASPISLKFPPKDERSPARRAVPSRVWLVLGFLLVCLVFSHYLLPASPTIPTYSNAHLKSKNYLNFSEPQPNPFAFCPLYGPGDEVGATYGALSLSQSRLHLGSGHRIQKVINRALAGQPVTISILGGSGQFFMQT
jgi:hypothetical protein